MERVSTNDDWRWISSVRAGWSAKERKSYFDINDEKCFQLVVCCWVVADELKSNPARGDWWTPGDGVSITDNCGGP